MQGSKRKLRTGVWELRVSLGKDPATGKVIKSVTDKVGSATITEVDDDSATATFAGSGGPKVGDMVNN